jgi:hypothetical protein
MFHSKRLSGLRFSRNSKTSLSFEILHSRIGLKIHWTVEILGWSKAKALKTNKYSSYAIQGIGDSHEVSNGRVSHWYWGLEPSTVRFSSEFFWIFSRPLTILIIYCCVGSWRTVMVSSSAMPFLSLYLSLRFQCVSSGGRLSDLLPINVDVSQGSIFRQLLSFHFSRSFTFYWWSLWSCPHVDLPFEAIFRWSVENGLSRNSGKTQAMIICRDRGRKPAVLVDGRTVPYSASEKNLEITIDNRFSWRDQGNCVRRNVGFILRRLGCLLMWRRSWRDVQSLVILHF